MPANQEQAARLALIEDLLATDLVSDAALSRARLVSERTGQHVEQVLNQLGVLNDEALRRAYSRAASCDEWNPIDEPVLLSTDDLGVSVEFLRQKKVLPLREDGDGVLCAACDPLDQEAIAGLVFAVGKPVRIAAASPSDWRKAFAIACPDTRSEVLTPDERRLDKEVEQVADLSFDGVGSRLVASTFEAAAALGASDIHFEPRRHDLRIRFRLDGRLVDHQVVAADLGAPALARIKVLANLDLGERRLPQDGRSTFIVEGRSIDVRVSVMPTAFGESAVLRILDRASVQLRLDSLGFGGAPAAVVARAATITHGMFLVSGPTGSGKTTTLYALLETLAGSAKKILSVEDPIEYHFDHVVQTQVAPALGLTFASALRSFLRQDPDVILVGEIRDQETAVVAIQAAMTGHLVLASVHANDALTVVPRLLDMGIEPYQLAAGFRGAAAQRLVRRLCVHCRAERPARIAEQGFARRAGATEPATYFDAVGCKACQNSGYSGRISIVEAFMADEAFLREIAGNATREALATGAARAGLLSMMHDGLGKARAGLTTVEEVMRALSD